ncbi:hypothetical protein C0Q70_02003 [Pomacea canaliculata]|uniref:Fucosyltransferase n=1 Tax=Pomacea canaliculata TaxID=400727 RepID=A0A2T7Q129_POMCA|nr:hypothetical protein C0Q70_02003 [Pomacea canaliculata]
MRRRSVLLYCPSPLYETPNAEVKDANAKHVFVFYGTDLKISDLPLPRQPHHEWAVLHEESPKNNILFSFQDMLVLFNHTCTFRRESDYAITTQHLKSQKWLLDTKYMKSTHDKNAFQKTLGLAPIIFTHSDCDPPSDRDHFVQLLMKHIPVDSYGKCLNNRRLPESLQDPIKGMEHNEFFELVSKYKFSLAMENAVCKDYITEKLWRPLVVGSVPVIFGSPDVKDMLPSDHSGVVITDFATVENLAKFLHYLNNNDSAYEEYLNWKLTGITNPILKDILSRREWSSDQEGSMDFVTNFECFICKRLHENRRRMQKGLLPLKHVANESHYGCPVPHQFDENGQVSGIHKRWMYEWSMSEKMAKAVRQLVEAGKNFTLKDLDAHLSLDL